MTTMMLSSPYAQPHPMQENHALVGLTPQGLTPSIDQLAKKVDRFASSLHALREEADATMGGLRQHGARAMGILGGAASDGLGVAAGYYAYATPQLAAAAKQLHLTQNAAAVLLAVAVCTTGLAITWLATAGVLSLARRGLTDAPSLKERFALTQQMHQDLAKWPNKTQADVFG